MLRVLSLNIWNREGPWPARRALIRDWIARLAPDVIGMQEVLRGQSVDQAAEIFAGTGYHLAYAKAQDFWLDGSVEFGNLIASRLPIEETATLVLPSRDGKPDRVALGATLAAPFGPISFTTTHLTFVPFDTHVREQQVLALSEFVLRRRPRGGFPPVFCGDFNTTPDASPIRYLRGLQSLGGRGAHFIDAWEQAGDGTEGHTMVVGNPHVSPLLPRSVRLDYVFVGAPTNTGGRVGACVVTCNEPAGDVMPSDHYGVLADLQAPAMPHQAPYLGDITRAVLNPVHVD